jgi:hypothetical protein
MDRIQSFSDFVASQKVATINSKYIRYPLAMLCSREQSIVNTQVYTSPGIQVESF